MENYDNYDEYNNYGEYEEYNVEESQNEEANIGLTKSTSYSIIKDEEIEALRDKLIKSVEDYCSLSRDDAILVCLFFKWNVEKIQEKWYDNSDMYMVLSGVAQSRDSLKELEKSKVKPNNKECSVCCMEEGDCEGGFISMKCKHNFCIDCYKEHVKAKVSDIHSILTTTCPQSNCNLIIPESIFIKLLKEDKTNYQNFKVGMHKNFTDYNSDVKWCPNKGCDACVRCQSKSNKEIDCICGYTFCFKCIKEGHRPCSCEMVEVWDKKNNSESENVKWITANTKQCPGCKKFIEKNQGCNHMTCRKEAGGCGHEFCWLCFADWKGHSACNKFQLDEAGKQEKNKQKIKLELEKYIHYFNRYVNHGKAYDHARRMRNSIEYTIYHFHHLKNIPLFDLTFLRDSVETIIKSRRLLKYSYVFGFYLKDTCKQKQLFEHTQWKLESNADRLHELLENETMSTLMALSDFEDFTQSFQSFRNSIIDLYSATNTFIKNLLSEIENTMLDLVDYKKLTEK
jgi:ariadne-1